ncbi:MAG: hypothetical protein Q9174_002349, partial [Haloplaca sp. 1 TL-2023]
MSVRIALEDSQQLYTNLDFIRGNVILSLRGHEAISAITVKLEGESKSRLVGELPIPYGYGAGFGRRRDETTMETEVHKDRGETIRSPSTQLLYKKLTVCPPPGQPPGLAPMLSPGQHTFPFEFKERDFNFFPIEPPRAAPSHHEFYARLDHAFAPVTEVPAAAKSTFFARKPLASAKDGPIVIPPVVRLDARLPHPAIITCNKTIPLRILVHMLNASPANIYLQLLQIELVAYTRVRAHHLISNNATSTVIISKSNMHQRLSMNDEKISEIDQGLWKDLELPSTIAPTFDTCNITRTYQVHVKIGLIHGHGGHVFPELNVQTLKLAVDVYSGIAPPPALLQAMSSSANTPHATNAAPSSSTPPPKPPRPSSSFSGQNENPQIIHSEIPIGSGQTHPVGPPPPSPNAPVETGPE